MNVWGTGKCFFPFPWLQPSPVLWVESACSRIGKENTNDGNAGAEEIAQAVEKRRHTRTKSERKITLKSFPKVRKTLTENRQSVSFKHKLKQTGQLSKRGSWGVDQRSELGEGNRSLEEVWASVYEINGNINNVIFYTTFEWLKREKPFSHF